jgi:hypothetical protein
VLKPNKTLYLYVEPVAMSFSPSISGDAGDYQDIVGVPETLEEQTIGNPTATVHLHYNSDYYDKGRGTLTIDTTDILERGVIQVQLVTRLYDSEGSEVFSEENGLYTNSLRVMLGYDEDNGGGGCGVLGAGAFLLPLIPLAARVKRKKT